MPDNKQNQTQASTPQRIDAFAALMDPTLKPDDIVNNIPDGYELGLQPKALYQEKYGKMFKSQEDFDRKYQQAGEMRNLYSNNKASFGNIKPVGAEIQGYGSKEADYAKSGNAIKYTPTDPIFESYIDARTGKYASAFSEEQQASLRGFYFDDRNGQHNKVNGSPSKSDKFINNYVLKKDEQDRPYWAQKSDGDDLYKYKQASVWGDQEKYGAGLMDGIFGFASAATVETLQTFGTLSVIGNDLTTWVAGKPSNTDFKKTMLGLVNMSERLKYKPSQEVEAASVFDFGIGTYYNFGKGLGYLLPQRWGASITSVGMKGLASLELANPSILKAIGKFAANPVTHNKVIGAAAMTIGAIQPSNDLYRQARQNGIDTRDAAGLALLATIPVFMTEKLMSVDWMTRGLTMGKQKVWTKSVAEAFDETKAADMIKTLKTESGKIKFLNTVFEKMGKLSAKAKLGSKDLGVVKNVAVGMGKETAQEASEEYITALGQMLYDHTVASDKQAGQGAFGMTHSQAVDNALVGGFMGGLLGGITSAFIKGGEDMNEHRQEQFLQIYSNASKGGKEAIDNSYKKIREKIIADYAAGKFKNPGLNTKGQVDDIDAPDNGFQAEIELPGLENNFVKTEADLSYFSVMMQNEEAYKLTRESGINDPEIVNLLGGSDEFMLQTMKNTKSQKEVSSKLSEIDTQLSQVKESDANHKELVKEKEKLSKELEVLKIDYNELTAAEPGTKYSKRVNDRIKQVRVRTKAAKDITEQSFLEKKGITVNDDVRNTEEYQAEYKKNLMMMNDHYMTSKNLDSQFENYLTNLKETNDQKIAGRQTTVDKLNETVTALKENKINKDNIVSELSNLKTMLTDISTGDMNFNIDDTLKASYKEAVNKVKSVTGPLYDTLAEELGFESEDFNNIDIALNDFNNTNNLVSSQLETPLSKEIYRIGDKVSVGEKNVNGHVIGLTADSDIQVPESIQYNVKLDDGSYATVTKDELSISDNLEIDPEKEYSRFLLDSLYQQYNSLKFLIQDNKGEGSSIHSLQSMITKTQDAIEFFETSIRAKNILNNEDDIQEHISVGERTIDDDTYNSLINGYNELKIGLKKLDDDLQKLTGASSVFSFRSKQAHQRVNKMILDNMFEHGFKDVLKELNLDDKISKLSSIEVANEDIVQVSKNLEDESLENEKQLIEIFDTINANADKVFTQENIDKFLSSTFLVDKPRVFYQTSEESPGAAKYSIDKLINVNKDNFSDPMLYTATINLFSRLHGVNSNDFNNSRLKLLDNISLNVSSYEQQIAEMQTVAFLNKGSEILEKVIASEIAYNKKAKPGTKGMTDDEIATMRGHFIKDSLMIQGWYGTGKTHQVLPNALTIYSDIFGDNLSIGIAGITTSISQNISDDLSKNMDTKKIGLSQISAADILNGKANLNNLNILVWDEASFLTKEAIYKVKDILQKNDVKVLFLGDESQMIPVDSGEAKRWAAQVGLKTTPLTNIYRNDNPLIQGLAKWMIDGNLKANRSDFLAENDSIPSYWYEENPDTKERFGVQYIAQESGRYNKGIVKEFLSRTSVTDKVLIFVDEEQFNFASKDFPELSSPELKERVKILDWNSDKQNVGCVQGLGFKEVYCAVDFQYWKNNSTRIRQSKLAWSAGYTAISRSRQFVAIPGPVTSKFKSRPIFFKNKVEVESSTKIENEIQNRIKRIEEEKIHLTKLVTPKEETVTTTESPLKATSIKKKTTKSNSTGINVGTAPSGAFTVKARALGFTDEEIAEFTVEDRMKILTQMEKPNVTDSVVKIDDLSFVKKGSYLIKNGEYAGSYFKVGKNTKADGDSITAKIYVDKSMKSLITKDKNGNLISKGAKININDISDINSDTNPSIQIVGETKSKIKSGEVYVDKKNGDIIIPSSNAIQGNSKGVIVEDRFMSENLFISQNEIGVEPEMLDDQLNNITHFKSSHEIKMKRNNIPVWGTTFTVLLDKIPQTENIRTVAIKKQAISHHLLNIPELSKQLVYMKEGQLIDTKDKGNNLLVVKLNVNDQAAFLRRVKTMQTKSTAYLSDALQDIIDNKGLPEYMSYVMALADTETGYMTNGIKSVVTNYSNTLSSINHDIQEGFSMTSKGDSKVDNSNIEINKALAALRHEGFNKISANENELVLGEITQITDLTPGRVIYGNERYTLDDFKNKLSADPLKSELVFTKDIHQLTTSDGRTKAVLHYAYGRQPLNTDPYVVFNMPVFNQEYIANKDISLLMNKEASLVSGTKWLSAYDSINLFNDSKNALFTMKFLYNNLKFINEDLQTNKLLRNYFKFPKGTSKLSYPAIDKMSPIGVLLMNANETAGKEVKGIGLEVQILSTFLNNFNSALKGEKINMSQYKDIKGYDEAVAHLNTITNVVSKMAKSMYMPTRIITGDSSSFGRIVEPNDLMFTNATDVHLPYAYADISSFVKDNTTEVDSTIQDDIDFINSFSSMPLFNRKTNIDSISRRRISQEEASKIIEKILGQDFLNNATEFKVGLTHNTTELFGMMRDGKIALELNSKGIESTTPRHEIFHLVWNYMLDPDTKSEIENELKSTLGKPNMSSLAAEEYMARRYGRTTKEGMKSAYSLKGIVQRFFNFLNGIFDKWIGSTPLLNDLFDSIENGTYRNKPINVESFNGQRNFDPNANEEMDSTEEMNLINVEDEIPTRETSAILDYVKMPTIFGNYKGFVRRDVAQQFKQLSYFSNNPNLIHVGTAESYTRIQKAYEEIGKKLVNKTTSFGIPVTELTKEHLPLIVKNQNDWDLYKNYKLSDKNIFDAFVKNIFPSIKLDTLSMQKHTSAVHYDDSTFNSDAAVGDNLKFQLEQTPLKDFVNNKLTKWDGRTYVSLNETSKIFSLAREATNKEYYQDTTQDYESLFKAEMKKLAVKAGEGTYRYKHVHSLMANFFEDYNSEGDNNVSYSMRGIVENLYHDSENIDSNRNRIIAVESLLNHINNTNKSLYMKNVSTVEYAKGEFSYSVADNGSQTRVKAEIVSNMKAKMFTGTVLNSNRISQLDPKSKNNLFKVEKDGLYWNKDNRNIKVISVSKNGVELTPEFDIDIMSHIKTFFGLGNIKDRVFYSMMHNYEGVNQVLNDMDRVQDLKFKSSNKGSEFLARGIMAMYYSTKVNIDMTNSLNELYKTVHPDDASFKVREASILNATESKSPLYDHMLNMYKGLGVNASNIDDIFESFSNEDEETQTSYNMPKPFDVFPFLNTLAEIEIYHRGSEELNFFYRPDGTKEYLHQLHSQITRTWHYGSDNILNEFEAKMKSAKTIISKEDFAKLSPSTQSKFKETETGYIIDNSSNSSYVDENGKPIYKLIDSKNRMRINTIRDFAGIKAMRGTTDPNMTDLTSMSFAAFTDSVIKSELGKLPRYNLLFNNISDKGKLYIAEVEFDAYRDNKLISVELSKDKKIKAVNINYKNVFSGIKNKFVQLKRLQTVSKNSWENFLTEARQDKTLTNQAFARLFDKKMSKAWEMNDLDSISKINQTFEASFETLSQEQKDLFLKMVQSSNLIEYRDYFISKGQIVLGNAINVNVNDKYETVYTAKNMYDILSQDETKIEHEKYLDRIFEENFDTREYSKYRNKLYESGYKVPEDIAKLVSGKSPMFNKETNQFNPFYKAHFFMNEIFQNEITPFVNGFDADYLDSTERSKRTGPLTTGATYMSTNVRYGLSDSAKMILINDHQMKSYFSDKKMKVADGQMIGNPLFKAFQMISIGGVDNAQIDNGMQKTLYVNNDMVTGKLTQIKHANLIITTDTYKRNPMYRLMLKDMLDATTKAAIEDIQMNRDMRKLRVDESKFGVYDGITKDLMDFNLNDEFTKFFKQTKDINAASELLRNWIEEESGVADSIKKNLVWGMQYKSGSKVANSRINTYDLDNRTDEEQNFNMTDIDTNKLGLVLNPFQDIEQYKNVAPMNQILAFLGVGNDSNSKAAMRTYDAFTRMYDLEDANVKKDIEKDFDSFIREKGLLSLRSSGFVGSLEDALNDPSISIQIPSFRGKLIQVFRNYLTERMIRQRMFGIRVNQASGYGFLMFEKEGDGIKMTLDQIENEHGVEFNLNELVKIINTGGTYEGYKVRGLNTMKKVGDKIVPAEVGVSYSYFTKFGLRPGEQVSDVSTLRYNNSEAPYVLSEDLNREELTNELTQEFDMLDLTETIAARKYLESLDGKAINKEEAINSMVNYIESFNKTLSMYVARVPSSRLGSGALVKPTFFIQDSANVIVIPVELTELNDSDFDIDQLSLYQYSLDNDLRISKVSASENPYKLKTFEQLNDYVLENLMKVYSDPQNEKDIIIASDIQELRDAAEGISKMNPSEVANLTEDEVKSLEESEKSRTFKRKNSFSTFLNDYEVNAAGKKAIAIMARSLSATSYILQLKESEIEMFAPGFKNIRNTVRLQGNESSVIRIGNYLQAALDNAKELILGNMNIGIYGTPLVAPMILDGWSNAKIKAFFSHSIIKRTLSKIEDGDSVQNKKSDYKVFDIIAEMKKGLKPLSEEEMLEAKTRLDELAISDPLNPEYDELYNKIYRSKSLGYLNTLQDLVTKGESLRRFGDVLATRNGLKVHDFEFEKTIESFEQTFGMTLEDFVTNDKENGIGQWNIKNHIDYFINHNNDYASASRFDKSQAVIAENEGTRVLSSKAESLINRETDIASQLDIVGLTRKFKHFNSYIKLYQEEQVRTATNWMYDSPGLKSIADEYLKTMGVVSWDFKNRRTAFYNTVSKALVSYHFTNHDNYKNEVFNLNTPIEERNGELMMLDRTLANIKLNTAEGRLMFKKQFPAYISFIQDTIQKEGIRSTETFKKLGMDLIADNVHLLIDNAFIDRIQSYPRYNRDVLILRESIGINEHELKRLQESFSNLPEELQKMFAVNDFINYAFQYRNGTISDVIGLKYYRDLTESIKSFDSMLSDDKQSDYRRALGSGIVSHTQHSENGTPAYNKSIHKAVGQARPELVVKRVKIKDGIYMKRHLRYNPTTDLYEDSDAEFLITDEVETNKSLIQDPNFQYVSKMPSIKIFNSEQLSELKGGQYVVYPFRRGTNYKEGERYILETGETVFVYDVSKDYSEVTFKQLQNESSNSLKAKNIISQEAAIKMKESSFSLESLNEIKEYYDGRRLDKSSIKIIVDQLSKTSNIPFIQETNQSVKNKFDGGISARSWIDNDGFHYNIDRIRTTDFLHEISHLWFKAIKQSDPELWNDLVDNAVNIIESNDPIYLAIKNKLNDNNLVLSKDALIDEVVANIAGLATEKSVEAFLLSNKVTKANDKDFVSSIWNKMRLLSERIRSVYSRERIDYTDSKTKIGEAFKTFAQSSFRVKADKQYSQVLMAGFNRYNEIFASYAEVNKTLSETLGSDLTHSNETIMKEAITKAQDKHNAAVTYTEVFMNDGSTGYKAQMIEPNTMFSAEAKGYEVANDTIEFMSLFNNNTTPQVAISNIQNDRLANSIVNTMMENGTQGKAKDKPVYEYNLGDRVLPFSKGLSFDALKQSVLEEIIPMYNKFEEELKPNIVEFSRAFQAGEKDFNELGKAIYGNKFFSDSTISQLVDTLGITEGFVNIYRYSDILNRETNESIRSLYTKEFTGFDPLVVIHNIDKDGVIDLSLIDITSKPITRNSKDLSQRGLQSLKEYDFDYWYKGGRYENHDKDIRKVLLGMTALSMSKNSKANNNSKPNIKIRNIGVSQLVGNNVSNHMITDFNEVVNEIKLLKDNKKFMQHVSNNEILDVLEDNSLYNQDVQQSYMSRLKTYLQYRLDNNAYSYEGKVLTEQLSILNNPKASKSDLMAVLQQRKSYIEGQMELREAYSTQEYQWLGESLKELQMNKGYVGRINEIKSMREYEMMMTTAHDLGDDNLQWFVNTTSVTKNIIVEEMVSEQNKMKSYFEAALKRYESRNPSIKSSKYTKDVGSQYFKHLYKTTMIDGVEVTIPELHWTEEHIDTKKLMDKGIISKEDLIFTNQLLDTIEDRWIKNQLHRRKQMDAKITITGKSKIDYSTVKGTFVNNINYKRGMIPMIGKNANELLFSGQFSSATKRFGDVLGNFEMLFEGDDTGSTLNEVSNALDGQYRIETRYSHAGLEYEGIDADNNPIIKLADSDTNKNLSTNLENTFNYFMLAGIRQEQYENRVVPVYNSVKAILTMYKSIKPEDESYMHYNLKWVDEYMNRVIHRTTGEQAYTAKIPLPKTGRKYDAQGNKIMSEVNLPTEINIGKAAKGLVGATSFVTLGYSTGVAFKSLLFNEISLFMNSAAATLSGAQNENAALPGLKHVHQATKIALGGGEQYEFKKARRLALDMQLILRSERDVLENPFVNLTNKNIFQASYAHMMNWGTDSAARMIAMIAIMKKDGSWDAYTYNEKEGTVTYNEKKDSRFYDSNGNEKRNNGEHAIKEHIRQQLIEQGSQLESNKLLTRGYDFQLIDGTMKWYADKYIIGTMDELTKPIIGNRFVGAALSNFKMFSFSRLFNAGVFAETRKTTRGAGYKAIKDENGEWISVQDMIEIEGALQSFSKAMAAFKNMGTQDISQWWKDASPVTRMNIAKTFLQVGMFSLIYGLVHGAWDDDKFTWAYTDIFIAPLVSDVLSGSPFPTYNIISDFTKAASGGEIEKMAKTFGVTRNIIKGTQNLVDLTNINEEK